MKNRRLTAIYVLLIMTVASLGSAAVFAEPYEGQYYYTPYQTYGTYNTYGSGGYTYGYGVPAEISIAFTGDIRSHIRSEDGRGGISRISTFLKGQKEKNADLFYVDAGNFSMGTPFRAAFSKEALELRGLADIGCDVTTLGVEEYGYGLRALGKMLRAAKKKAGDEKSGSSESSPVPYGYSYGSYGTYGTSAYGTTSYGAESPQEVRLPYIVCSNIDWKKTLDGPKKKDAAYLEKAMKVYGTNGFRSITKNGKKIVVIGLMGKKAASKLESKGIYFKDPAKAAKDTIKRMKKKVKDVDLIVCLGQFGADSEKKTGTSEAKELAGKVKDIDVIVVGNSRKGLPEAVKGGSARITSAGANSRLAGIISFTEKTAGKKNYRYTKSWLKKLDSSVAKDSETEQTASELESKLNSSYFEKYGYKAGQKLADNWISFPDIDKFKNGNEPDSFGDFLVDSYYMGARKAGRKDIAVAIASTKSIDRVLPKGEITVDDAFDMSSERIGPDGTVGSALVKVYFTGRDLKNIAEAKVSVIPEMKDTCFYMSGIRYSYNTHRVKYNKVFKVTGEDGKALDEDTLYAAVCDLEFLGMVSDISGGGMGMIPIEIRDKDGNAVPEKKWEGMTIERKGVELKIWQAVADKLRSFDGKVPADYAKARNEAVESSSFSPAELFGSPNRAGWISYCIALVVILAIVLVIILIVSKRRRSYASRVRREARMFSGRKRGGARRAQRRSQKKIFSNKKNRFW